MTAQEARHHLAQMGIGLEKYTNPMAVLHSVLKRVGVTRRNDNGQVEYGPQGIIPPQPALPGPVIGPPGLTSAPPPPPRTMGPVERRKERLMEAEDLLPPPGPVKGPGDIKTGFKKR